MYKIKGWGDTLNIEASGSSKSMVPASKLCGITYHKTVVFISKFITN
jgi:hypothetical protein